MTLNINTDAAIKFTNKLEKLHRSALPVAVRSALNSAAFNVKQKTMPAESESAFVNRQKNFFKANSRVDMAKGFNLKTMKATVGFTDQGLQGNNNYAVKDLEQQEYGGTLKKKSFIPTDTARGGGSAVPVRPKNRLSAISRIANSKNVKGKNKHERFVKSAVYAGVGGYVIGSGMLFRVSSIKIKKAKVIGRYSNTKIKVTPIYSYKENRQVNVKATGFMRSASLRSAGHLEKFYQVEAEKQIKRLMK